MISDNSLKKLEEIGAKRVFLQFPEGLIPSIQKIAKYLEKKGFEVFLSMEPTFGACDIRDYEAKLLKCDAILHIGHSDIGLTSKLPVVFDEYKIDIDLSKTTEKHVKKIVYNRIGLLTTLQFIKGIDIVKRVLEAYGKNVVLGKSKRIKYHGQVLGCDYSSAISIENSVDCFLFFGTGRFHPLGLLSLTKKPVFFLDIERDTLEDMSKERDKIRIKRNILFERVKKCSNFGILISVKKGQLALEKAKRLKRFLERKGKNVYILVFNRVTPEKLIGLKIDCLVNTACPRLSEDYEMFKKPIINEGDVINALKST